MFLFSFLSDHDKRNINLKKRKKMTFFYNRLHTNVYDLKPRSVDKYVV